jgi:hypothetical protein
LVVVGKNGTGKSILLSYIVDALVELAKLSYEDIVTGQQFGISPFFKLSGPLNQRFNSKFSVGLLEFSDGDKKFSYVDKTGTIESVGYFDKLSNRFSNWTWKTEGNDKKVSGDKNEIERIFKYDCICYFPPSRKEKPHWLNSESVQKDLSFDFEENITGVLDKPIYVESCVEDNKKWVLDVFLDSKVDFQELSDAGNESLIRDKQLLTQTISKQYWKKF